MSEISLALLTKNEPGEVHAFAAGRPRSIGDLVAFANTIPADHVAQVALSLSRLIVSDGLEGPSAKSRLRQLVIFGALVNRLIFEIEAVPEVITHLI